MTSTLSLRIEQDLSNPRYLKCLAEGMKDWIEVKSQTGNEEITQYKKEIQDEIVPSEKIIVQVLEKMKSLGIRKDLLTEFKSIFNKKILN